MKKIILVVVCFSICLKLNAQFKVVAYLPNFTSLENSSDAFDYSKITHLNIAFFNPDIDGNFSSEKAKGLDRIITKAHKNKVKVLLSLAGGSDQGQYHTLLKAENRAAFIEKIMDLVKQYNADGIDVDIEGKNIDENYEAFVTELATKLKQKDKLITGAVAWWTRAKITDACLKAYDFINLMAYGGNANLHASMDYAKQIVNYWKNERGLPKEKLVLGTAFYGRYDTEKSFVAIKYKDLIVQYPGAENKDSLTRSEDGLIINYNGIKKTKERTAFAYNECGGIMIWQILQDAPGPLSLLKAIDDEITEIKAKR